MYSKYNSWHETKYLFSIQALTDSVVHNYVCVNLPGPENNYGYAFNTGYAQQRNPVNEVSQKTPLAYFYLISSIVTEMFNNKLHDLSC